MKKILALLLTLTMIVGLAASALAADAQHTITITNADQYVPHTYEGYQVFAGDLSADGTTLSNVVWGDGVDGDALLSALTSADVVDALKGDDPLTDAVETTTSIFASCTSAADVASVLASYKDTAAIAEAFADVVADNLDSDGKFSFTADAAGTTYTATVPGDGYYFIQDVTTTLTHDNTDDDTSQSDTLSKYILQVVKDVTVIAKDTGFPLDKTIDVANAPVKEGTFDIGDEIPYTVTTIVPDTTRFSTFTFKMQDKLDAGLTYFDSLVVKIDGTEISGYTTTVTTGDAAFTTPASAAAAVTTTGGQKIVVDFTSIIKTYGDATAYQGKELTVEYKAILNQNAETGETPNKNEVVYIYSDNPNDLTSSGTTPSSTTDVFTTKLDVLKVDGSNNALEGAVFELSGTTFNFVVVNGDKFEPEGYTPVTGETIEGGDSPVPYWQLKSDSYTDVDPSTVGVDESQYVDPDVKYVKVTMTNVVQNVGTGSQSITVVSDAEGKMSFTGLKPGSYTLTEIAPPDGFNAIVDPISINITWDTDNGWQIDANSDTNLTLTADGTFAITIVNQAGSILPSTGGIGTTIFYIVGGLMAVGAGVVLVTRKRMSREEN